MADALTASFTKRFPGGTEIRVEQLRPGKNVAVLFGPSGGGKTTVLRCLAGLERPETGVIQFGAETWFDARQRICLTPQQRGIGFVFQDYALFPHLTVEDNIGFGLNGLPAAGRRQRIGEMLERFDLGRVATQRPRQLSGGEQQRVALARALARQPRLLLLDEPLSALDTPTRQRLRGELADLLAKLNRPAIVVTHDRLEAAVLGEEMFVLAGGEIRQHGTVAQVFNRPASLEVARLVGTDTVLACKILNLTDGLATLEVGRARLVAMADHLPPGARTGHVCIRAEDVILSRDAESHASPRNRYAALVKSMTPEGPLVRLELDCGFPLKALLTRQSCAELQLQPGNVATALIKASQAHLV